MTQPWIYTPTSEGNEMTWTQIVAVTWSTAVVTIHLQQTNEVRVSEGEGVTKGRDGEENRWNRTTEVYEE